MDLSKELHETERGFSSRDRYTLTQASNLFVVLLGTVGVIFKLVVVGIEQPPTPMGLVALAGLANYQFLAKRKSVDVAAWILIAIMVIVLLIFAGYNSGAYGGPLLTAAPLIPVLAIVLINGRAGVIVFIAVSGILLTMLGLQLGGLVPENPNSAGALAVGNFLSIILTSAVCTIVIWRFAGISRNMLFEITEQANTDPLTGLYNRRPMEMAIHSQISQDSNSAQWMSLIIADVDNFKKFNDVNGHPAGDACLIAVADVIKSCANRSLDMVGRIGGEEFMVFLPRTNQSSAEAVAEKIRQALLDKKIPYMTGNEEFVSLTLGVVSEKCDYQCNFEMLFDRADAALYQGKRQGRNQVLHWHPQLVNKFSVA